MSAQPTLVTSISNSDGDWNTASYIHVNTDTTNTYYEYKLSINSNTQYYIAYNWSTGKWFDTDASTHHNTFGTSVTDLTATSRESTVDPATVYVMETQSPRCVSVFTNPYHGTFSAGTPPPTNSGSSSTQKKVFCNFW